MRTIAEKFKCLGSNEKAEEQRVLPLLKQSRSLLNLSSLGKVTYIKSPVFQRAIKNCVNVNLVRFTLTQPIRTILIKGKGDDSNGPVTLY